MKRTNIVFSIIALVAILFTSSCSKDSSSPSPTTGAFTAKIDGDAFTAPDAYILNGASGTNVVFATDAKSRSFQMAIQEKDFPLNTAVDVAFSASISYKDAAGTTFIAKSGTVTFTEFGKNNLGTVNHMVGSFSIVVTSGGVDLTITEGKFDVKTK